MRSATISGNAASARTLATCMRSASSAKAGSVADVVADHLPAFAHHAVRRDTGAPVRAEPGAVRRRDLTTTGISLPPGVGTAMEADRNSPSTVARRQASVNSASRSRMRTMAELMPLRTA